MADISSIMLFGGLAVLALVLLRLANRQQVKSQLIGLKVLRLKRRVEELETLLTIVEPLTESLAIPQLVNQEIIELLTALGKLEKNNPAIEKHLEDALAREEDLADPARARKLYRVLRSDAEIARAHYLIGETARIVQRHHRQNKVSEADRKALLSELRWAHVMVSTLSLVAQGHKALTRGDPSRAYAYYKNAHHKLITSAVNDERRPRLAKQLEEIFAGTRMAISADLMPETDYNPPEGTPGLTSAFAMPGHGTRQAQ